MSILNHESDIVIRFQIGVSHKEFVQAVAKHLGEKPEQDEIDPS